MASRPRQSGYLLAAALMALALPAFGQPPAAPAAPGGAAAAGDPVAGEKVFGLCGVCHRIGPGAMNAVGPVLNGVVGRKAGTYPGFMYSDANKNSGVTWTEAALTQYLPDPQKFIPSTPMSIGVPSAEDVQNVIAYLKQFDAQGNKAAK